MARSRKSSFCSKANIVTTKMMPAVASGYSIGSRTLLPISITDGAGWVTTTGTGSCCCPWAGAPVGAGAGASERGSEPES